MYAKVGSVGDKHNLFALKFITGRLIYSEELLLLRTFVYAMVGFVNNISPLQALVPAFLGHSHTDFI